MQPNYALQGLSLHASMPIMPSPGRRAAAFFAGLHRETRPAWLASQVAAPKPVVGRVLGRSGVACQASPAEANGSPIVTGPIAVNPSMSPALDPVSASATGPDGKMAKAVDRSKGLWTRCDKCGTILYIKHLKEHHHICFGCNYHLKVRHAQRLGS